VVEPGYCQPQSDLFKSFWELVFNKLPPAEWPEVPIPGRVSRPREIIRSGRKSSRKTISERKLEEGDGLRKISSRGAEVWPVTKLPWGIPPGGICGIGFTDRGKTFPYESEIGMGMVGLWGLLLSRNGSR
jgi:hypothetical protein